MNKRIQVLFLRNTGVILDAKTLIATDNASSIEDLLKVLTDSIKDCGFSDVVKRIIVVDTTEVPAVIIGEKQTTNVN
jgi:hypothetical protein